MKYNPMTLLITADDEGKIDTFGTGVIEGEDFYFFLGLSKSGKAVLINMSDLTPDRIAWMLRKTADGLIDPNTPKRFPNLQDESENDDD